LAGTNEQTAKKEDDTKAIDIEKDGK